MNTVTYELNKAKLTFERETGALVSLEYPGAPALISGGEGLCDMAWPVHNDYDILRAYPTAQYNKKPPEITFDGKTVTLFYSEMPRSMPTPDTMSELAGGIETEITVRACDDGKSISMRCRVKNNSQAEIAQILFPSICGINQLTDDASDRVTMLAGSFCPFRDLRSTPQSRETFFAWTDSASGRVLHCGGLQTAPYTGRWFDIGSRDAGISVYRRHWGWGPDDKHAMDYGDALWVKLNNLTGKLRIAAMRDTALKNGEEYDSGEYIITPHTGPWLCGIAPYKAYVKENVKRVLPVPQRAREMLGFRTIFMANGYPADPTDYSWKYDDLPRIADDMKEHGLYDLNIWGCFNYSLPIGPGRFYEQWGGQDEFVRNVRKVQEKGVTVTPLVSWISLWDETCQGYGITERSGSWAETPKSVPMFKAPYCKRWSCLQIQDHTLECWRRDVHEGLRYIRDVLGCPDICWDQYVLGNNQDDIVHDIINEYRLETEEVYPGTVFSSESTLYFSSELDNTDFTWNWLYWGKQANDLRPYMHVVETCRPNMNVDSDAAKVRFIFMDNLMMNVYPTLPENYNGSALISEYPEYSQAVKTCARLRREYLEYFTDGTMVGDCPLKEEPWGRATGYLLGERLLLAIYKGCDADMALTLRLSLVMDGADFETVIHDENGNEVSHGTVKADGTLTVSGEPGRLYMAEIKKIG